MKVVCLVVVLWFGVVHVDGLVHFCECKFFMFVSVKFFNLYVRLFNDILN